MKNEKGNHRESEKQGRKAWIDCKNQFFAR